MKYLFLSATTLVLFYLFYKLLLSRDTLHRFNRVVLLTLLVLTAVLPLLRFDFGQFGRTFSYTLQEFIFTPANGFDLAEMASTTPEGYPLLDAVTLSWSDSLAMTIGVAFVFYLLVTAVLTLFFIVRIAQLIFRCLNSATETLPDGSRLLLHDDSYAPYSWMHTIVVSRKDYAANGPLILAHEQAHIRLHHSWDLLIAQLCCVVQWFNPAAWLMKKELQAVHEYEADAAMLRSGCNARNYQMKLIETALGARFSSMANNFTTISTKKRILMMLKSPTSPWARLKVLLLVPVAFATLFVSSCNYTSEPGSDKPADTYAAAQPVNETTVVGYAPAAEETPAVVVLETTDTAPAAESVDQSEIFPIVEAMPEFPGGMEALMKFLSENIKYPASCQKQKVQGRVVVQFVINKDGSVVEAEVIKPVHPDLDKEALRIVSLMPKWTPGKEKGEPVRVKFTLPILFKLK